MIIRLAKRSAYFYNTLTPEDYLYNQRDAMLAKKAHRKTLEPLMRANQGDLGVSDEIQLMGVPKGQTKEILQIDTFEQLLKEG